MRLSLTCMRPEPDCLRPELVEGAGLATLDYEIPQAIPAGGLFSGAEDIKTPQEAAIYGGTAGKPYDSCYHQACDTINNLNSKALSELGDGAAHATLVLALSKTGLYPDGSRQAQAKVTGKAAKRSLQHAR
jgi:peptidase M28-like protein